MAKSRKDLYYHRGEPKFRNKALKVLGVIAVVAVVLGGAWALTLFQPRKVGWEELGAPSASVPPSVSALHDKSLALESDFNNTEKIRAITPADLENLREALRLENEYLAQAKGNQQSGDRLVALTGKLETYEAKPLREQSSDLEVQAAKLESSGDLAGARKLYNQAADLEDTINTTYPHSTYKLAATNRSATLHHRVQYLTAMPLHDESVAAEDTAKAALDRQDWPTALDNFKHAYDLQLRLNREFFDQSFASAGRLQSIEDQITGLESLPDHQKIEKLIADGKTAEATQSYDKAAELYQEAERQQRALVSTYPKSRFATDATVIVSLENKRETALSRPLANEIITQATALFDDLRHRRTDNATTTIVNIWQKASHFHETYPSSLLLDDELQKRLDYLYYKRNDLATIQQQVYAELLAVPGDARYLLGKQEVTQALYAAVAGGNPSRNPGPTLPVDSVNWNDAHELFCRRLSWILERPVRLPTLEQFKTALGASSMEPQNIATTTWDADNTGGKTQPVATKAANANGFYDLLGNVAEWLERPAGFDEDSAPVVGGSAQTPVDAFHTTPQNSLAIVSSNAFTGFRFVVDTDDTAPLLPASTIKVNQLPAPTTSAPANGSKSSSN